jgi:WD40 repeat protein
LALAFAHNFVEIYDIQPTVPKLLYSIQCQVRCILNSARFFGHTRKDLVLASGTVFNDIYLWKVEDGQVFRELKGHEGVIFSIRFNHDASRIISASDDRTVRVWGSDDAPLILFGHTARVWDCMFVDGYIVSISEDSTCRVWNEEGDCVTCWEGHAGKNIWSCAVDPEHKTVATGGQDSGILLWSMRSIENNKVDAKDDLNTFVLPKGKDSIRNFSFVNDSTLVVVTAMGLVVFFVNNSCDGVINCDIKIYTKDKYE